LAAVIDGSAGLDGLLFDVVRNVQCPELVQKKAAFGIVGG
jgi:hypothetical protein